MSKVLSTNFFPMQIAEKSVDPSEAMQSVQNSVTSTPSKTPSPQVKN